MGCPSIFQAALVEIFMTLACSFGMIIMIFSTFEKEPPCLDDKLQPTRRNLLHMAAACIRNMLARRRRLESDITHIV
jgi:hypothetical protein